MILEYSYESANLSIMNRIVKITPTISFEKEFHNLKELFQKSFFSIISVSTDGTVKLFGSNNLITISGEALKNKEVFLEDIQTKEVLNTTHISFITSENFNLGDIIRIDLPKNNEYVLGKVLEINDEGFKVRVLNIDLEIFNAYFTRIFTLKRLAEEKAIIRPIKNY